MQKRSVLHIMELISKEVLEAGADSAKHPQRRHRGGFEAETDLSGDWAVSRAREMSVPSTAKKRNQAERITDPFRLISASARRDLRAGGVDGVIPVDYVLRDGHDRVSVRLQRLDDPGERLRRVLGGVVEQYDAPRLHLREHAAGDLVGSDALPIETVTFPHSVQPLVPKGLRDFWYIIQDCHNCGGKDMNHVAFCIFKITAQNEAAR